MKPPSDILTAPGREAAKAAFDAAAVRPDFPILKTTSRGKPLAYLDNAATTQKPRQVIQAISHYYEKQNANIHRGVYQLSQVATEAYEDARLKVRRFINAGEPAEVIFTRGATEGINLVAACWARVFLKPGDEVIVSYLEHHSNIVPWQMACEAVGASLRVIPINDDGDLMMAEYAKLLSSKTRLVAINHVSNALGTINPVEEIIEAAHAVGAKVLVDGAQWVGHYPTDVRALDADFYVFSGHKLFGPTGIGVLYGKRALLDAMPPYQGGGDMIHAVTFEKTTYAELPNKFEAGTPDIAGAVGLGAAIDYLNALDMDAAAAHETMLLEYATEQLRRVPGLRIVGTAKKKAAVISFVMEDPPVASLDLGVKLDQYGIAVRTGHHCCQPIMDRFRISSTTRASFAFYNTRDEVDALACALKEIAAAATPKAVQQQVTYPKPFAKSPSAAADLLAEEFEFLSDRDTKNEYVLDLAKRQPRLFDLLRQISQPVPGCMSQVYLVGRQAKEGTNALEFVADADAEIVRGLIAILQRLYSGQRARDILAFDVEAFFRRIALDQFITSQRRNGLAGMVARIRQLATDLSRGEADGRSA